jgi:hypothetical protein
LCCERFRRSTVKNVRFTDKKDLRFCRSSANVLTVQ